MLMPALSGHPLAALRRALIAYAKKTGRRPSLEFTLIDGVNDTPQEVNALIEFARGMLCHVNLIPLNPPGSTGDFVFACAPGSSKRHTAIATQLRAAGVECSIRRSRGADISGACGQLKGGL
jgi:23S rRNA (adenine2503-C2)-methyltransferase